MQKANVPGLALAIIENKEIVYANGFGKTTLEPHGIPVTPETLFRFASVTKPMTSTLVMQLVEQGKLDLDTPVSHYSSELRFSEPTAADRLTLRHLLSHSSGLPMSLEGYTLVGADALENFIREVLPTLPLAGPPGKFWIYSNPGICTATYLAQLVTGQKYADLIRERIFEPVGMNVSTFDPLVAMTYPLALPYWKDDAGRLQQEHYFADASAFQSAGGIISNVLEVARFALLHLNKGRVGDKQLLAPATIERMYEPIYHLPNPRQSFFGLAVSGEVYKNTRQLGHIGGLGGYGSRLVFAPDHGCGVVMVYNWKDDLADEPDRLVNRILDELLGRPTGKPEMVFVQPNKALWKKYVGRYSSPVVGEIQLAEKDGELQITSQGFTAALQPLRADLYYADLPEGAPAKQVAVGIVSEPDGAVNFITVNEQICKREE